MLGRVALCGAAAALIVSFVAAPAPSAAKGFLGHAVMHTGFGHAHFRHHHHHGRWNYPYGYAYLPLGYDAPVIPEEVAVRVPYPVAPRCLHSVESVMVPAESGGLRRITITRC